MSHALLTKKIPAPIYAFGVIYFCLTVALLFNWPSIAHAVRLVLGGVLFFFVFRGSRFAGNLLAILSAAAGAYVFSVGVVDLFVPAGILLVFAAYMLWSRRVRVFQESARAGMQLPPAS